MSLQTPPFTFWDKRHYKKKYIERFGKDRFERDHNTYPEPYIDLSGNHAVRSITPEFPIDSYRWIQSQGWSIGIWSQMIMKESFDVGSNVQHNSAAVVATTKNVVDDVQAGTKRLLIGVGVAATAALLIIYNKPIKAAIQGVQKAKK